MSGFFKTNIYIYTYICMLCFVASAGAEEEKICIDCEGKQWCFTLDKTIEFGNKFYSFLESKKSLIKQAKLNNVPFNAITTFDSADISLVEDISFDQLKCKAGDIIISPESNIWFFTFLAQDTDYYFGFKVGELEESFIDDFKSFIKDKYENNFSKLDFTFSIKKPESLDSKIIVTIIWLLLLLPLLFLVYFIFK